MSIALGDINRYPTESCTECVSKNYKSKTDFAEKKYSRLHLRSIHIRLEESKSAR